MTKHELSQYRSIVAEIEEIRDRINSNTVYDTVVGSDTEFPFTAHTISVGGMTDSSTSQKDMLLLRRLEIQKQTVEDFINAIDDSQTRRIFRYRYMDGKVKPSWTWIAFKIGHYDESYPRRKHNEFLKMPKMPKNPC